MVFGDNLKSEDNFNLAKIFWNVRARVQHLHCVKILSREVFTFLKEERHKTN